jgi:hypothetical protein
MSFEEEHIDKVIKSKMDNFEIVPPEELWDNIEGALLKNKTIVKRNRIIAAVAAIVIVALLVVFLEFNKKNQTKQDEPKIQSADSTNIFDTTTFAVKISDTTSSIRDNTAKKEIMIQKKSSVNKIESKEQNDFLTTNLIEPANTAIMVDTIPEKIIPVEKVVVKKVIKKPVYVVQQDTIYKIDTLSKKKKW